MLPNNNSVILERLIRNAISAQESQAASESSMLYNISVDNDLVANVMEGVEYIESETDLLRTFDIWDKICSSQILSLICVHTTLCRTVMNSDDDQNINIYYKYWKLLQCILIHTKISIDIDYLCCYYDTDQFVYLCFFLSEHNIMMRTST